MSKKVYQEPKTKKSSKKKNWKNPFDYLFVVLSSSRLFFLSFVVKESFLLLLFSTASGFWFLWFCFLLVGLVVVGLSMRRKDNRKV